MRRRSRSRSNQGGRGTAAKLTPEQLRQVTEKVYALMLRDLKIEGERERFTDRRQPFTKRQGGW